MTRSYDLTKVIFRFKIVKMDSSTRVKVFHEEYVLCTLHIFLEKICYDISNILYITDLFLLVQLILNLVHIFSE